MPQRARTGTCARRRHDKGPETGPRLAPGGHDLAGVAAGVKTHGRRTVLRVLRVQRYS